MIIGKWNLSDINSVKKNELKVFSLFCCGGGSTMGYKLSGFDVLGGVEIDPKIAEIYRKNHKPKIFFQESIQDFNRRNILDLPNDLLSIDVLDGSPPCSSFSMAGSREKMWQVDKKFREGQTKQILDDLFFHFIETAKNLRPKIVISENVKGLVLGNARGYVKEIFEKFDDAGYDTQLFLLNASKMGVPQARERTFFISRRKDLKLPSITLDFREREISAFEATIDCEKNGKTLSEQNKILWLNTPKGKSLSFAHKKGSMFSWRKLDPRKPAPTITAGPASLHWDEPRHLSKTETIRLQSFPDDYDFLDQDPRYVCGMSVPPLMMHRLSTAIATHFFNK